MHDRGWQLVTHTVYYFQPVSTAVIVKMTNTYCISSLVPIIEDMLNQGVLLVHHTHWVDPTVAQYCLTPHGVRFMKKIFASGARLPCFRTSKENYLKLLRLRETGYLLDVRFTLEHLSDATDKQDLVKKFRGSVHSGDYAKFVQGLVVDKEEAQQEVEQLRSHPQLQDRNTDALYLQYVFYALCSTRGRGAGLGVPHQK